ncbi:MAG: hypothetical protein AB7P02_09245 [Alphaproteobacteria bacterium]
MFGLFGESRQRLFDKEMKARGAKIPSACAKELVATALSTLPTDSHGRPGTHGRNLGDDAVLHFAAWSSAIVNSAAGRPSRRTPIDPELYPETAALIRGILSRHGIKAG